MAATSEDARWHEVQWCLNGPDLLEDPGIPLFRWPEVTAAACRARPPTPEPLHHRLGRRFEQHWQHALHFNERSLVELRETLTWMEKNSQVQTPLPLMTKALVWKNAMQVHVEERKENDQIEQVIAKIRSRSSALAAVQ